MDRFDGAPRSGAASRKPVRGNEPPDRECGSFPRTDLRQPGGLLRRPTPSNRRPQLGVSVPLCLCGQRPCAVGHPRHRPAVSRGKANSRKHDGGDYTPRVTLPAGRLSAHVNGLEAGVAPVHHENAEALLHAHLDVVGVRRDSRTAR